MTVHRMTAFEAPKPAEAGARVRRVFVRDLVLACSIGVYQNERDAPQRVRINLDLAVPEDGRALNDDIANVVSYEDVVDRVRAAVARRHINLVETLAEDIASVCRGSPGSRMGLPNPEEKEHQQEVLGAVVEDDRMAKPLGIRELHSPPHVGHAADDQPIDEVAKPAHSHQEGPRDDELVGEGEERFLVGKRECDYSRSRAQHQSVGSHAAEPIG